MNTRLRYEYREMIEMTDKGMRPIHVVYDTWYNKVRTQQSSKYAAKQFIKRNQEELELDDQEEDNLPRPEQSSFRTIVQAKRL